MKTIVCFGDSNTWGYDPVTKGRFGRDVRWTGVLRQTLGEGYLIIEEGLNGRTTVWDDPIGYFKNGRDYLIPCLDSHCPFDLITIMLGTNDLKKRFSVSAYDIADSAGMLVDIVQRSKTGLNDNPPKVLLLCPPPVTMLTDFAQMFEDSQEKSRRLAEEFKRVAAEFGCELLDTSTVIVSSDLDGIHFEQGEHQKLGRAVAAKVKQMLEN